jgi:Family of unknown function (DUF6335)
MMSKQNEEQTPEITESYGTGVKELPDYDANGKIINDEMGQYTQTSPLLTGGDVDASWQDADAVGDEAVGGSSPTPDQSVTEELATAVGIEINDAAFLRTNEMLEQRDDQRYELDPTSSEDYSDRKE